MAANYAGAVAAIKAYLLAASLPVAAANIGFINEADPSTVDSGGNQTTWVEFEVVSIGSNVRGSGTPGQQTIVYDGLIKMYVFVPTGSGIDGGFATAVALGDIFKNFDFYNTVTDGCFIRTGYPSVIDGNATSDDGLWFGVTCSVPFEYWHRG